MPDERLRVYWDTCVFLDYISEHKDHAPTIEALLSEADEGKREILTSVTTITEVAYAQQEKQAGTLDQNVEDRIETLWRPPSPVTLVEFHAGTARIARALVRTSMEKGLGLKPFDAIHLATAKILGVAEFNTYDDFAKFESLVGIPMRRPLIEQSTMLLGEGHIEGTAD